LQVKRGALVEMPRIQQLIVHKLMLKLVNYRCALSVLADFPGSFGSFPYIGRIPSHDRA